jgi:hypothetical protein
MAHKAAPREVERFRTPNRSSHRLIHIGPPANDNRRPGGQRVGPWIWLAMCCAAAIGLTFLIV